MSENESSSGVRYWSPVVSENESSSGVRYWSPVLSENESGSGVRFHLRTSPVLESGDMYLEEPTDHSKCNVVRYASGIVS